MKSIEARDRVVVTSGSVPEGVVSQGVLPLYEQEIAEALTSEKRRFLEVLMTNVDGNVHAFRDEMPGILAGMLTARSSRSPEPDITEVLWREFVAEPELGIKQVMERFMDKDGISQLLATGKARAMTRRILERYGDDSVREDASGYVAVSNYSVLTSMETFWHPLLTGIEMSTRYIDWREKDADGNYHYVMPEVIANSEFAEDYRELMDGLFETYGELWQPVWDYYVRENPQQEGWSDNAYKEAILGATCDTLRKLLPMGIKTNFVLHAHYRTLSEVILNLRASRSQEAQQLADEMATELLKVNPEFIEVVENAHGARWVEHRRKQQEILSGCRLPAQITNGLRAVRVRVLNDDYRRDLSRLITGYGQMLGREHLEQIVGELEEVRTNRRHKVAEVLQGVTLEVTYDNISLSGYKDLNRQRNILYKTEPDWDVNRGYFVPDAILAIGGEVEEKYRFAQERAIELKQKMQGQFPEESRLVLTHGTKTSFTVVMGAAEGVWIEELRSIPSGDPEYRWFAQEEHRQRVKVMPELAAVGQFVDDNDYPLVRIKEAVRSDLKGRQ